MNTPQKYKNEAREMAQQVEALAAKSLNLSSIPKTDKKQDAVAVISAWQNENYLEASLKYTKYQKQQERPGLNKVAEEN